MQVQRQADLVPDSELEYQEQVIQEREGEIREIEAGIVELNEIFRDLGTIVTEQQSMLGMWSHLGNFIAWLLVARANEIADIVRQITSKAMLSQLPMTLKVQAKSSPRHMNINAKQAGERFVCYLYS